MGRHHTTPITYAVTLVACAACASQPALPPATEPAPQLAAQPQTPRDASKLLEGRWRVELTLDPLSMQNPPAAERVTGEIAFGSTAWWGSTDRFGRHDVDLRPFFGRTLARPDGVVAFSAADTSMVTEVSGSISGESIGIDFIPRIDHIGISLSGRFYGDSATGTWRRRGMEGSGRFWLRRESREPVSVAAIPVYTRISPAAPAAPIAVASADTAKGSGAKGKGSAAAKGARAAVKVASAKSATKGAASRATPAATPAAVPAAATLAQAPVQKPAPGVSTSVPPNVPPSSATGAAANAPAVTPPTAAPTAAPPAPRNLTRELSTAPPAATGPAATSADPKAMGTIRVRTLDKSSNQYFATKYSLHLPDGRWMYGTLRTGSGGEGWGVAVPRTAGRYDLEITDFVCGDKIWFLREPLRRTIVVEPGQPADVTIEMDLANLPARKSLDNPTGAKCTAPPGAAK